MEKIYIAHTSANPAARQVRPLNTPLRTVSSRRLLLSLLALLTASFTFGQTTWMGMRFTVGGTPLSINALGRMVAPGNSRTHQLKLVRASDGKDVPGSTVSVSLAGATAGQFKYASLPKTVTLPSNTAYYLVSSETQGGDSWYSSSTSVTTTGVATCFGGVFWDGSNWTVQGGTNNTFVPVSFTYGPRDPENPSGASVGVNYAYYQGSNWWDFRPNLDALNPVRTGTKTYFNISGNTQSDNFAFKFTGFIDVPTTGTYTFYTYADDACGLYIGGVQVVNYAPKNTVAERSGRIELKAGKHAFAVTYIESIGSQIFHHVKYEGPGVAKQVIPSSRVYRGGSVTTPTSTPTEEPVAVGPTFSGYYQLLAKHSGKAIDISDASTVNGADALQYTKGTGSNQQFSIQSVGSGYYKIVARHSGKVLAVTSSTGIVEQYTYTGTAMQQWKVELLSDGYYKITNRSTGKSLDVTSASTLNKARIQQWSYVGSDNQKWKLQSTSSTARVASAEAELEEAADDVTLFPNPAQDVVQVTYKAKADGQGSVQVSDATSQSKLSKTVDFHAGDNVIDLDVTSLPTGIYFLRFNAEGKEVTKKLVVAK
jgi:hypothetical protein